MKRSTRIIILMLLALLTAHISAPPPADAKGGFGRAPTTAAWGPHDTVDAYGVVWFIGQTAKFTISYGPQSKPTKLTFNWAYCKVDSILMGLGVSWCGATRINATTYDVGFNFTKSPFYVGGTQTCWVRARVTAQDNTWVGFPTLYFAETRRGC